MFTEKSRAKRTGGAQVATHVRGSFADGTCAGDQGEEKGRTTAREGQRWFVAGRPGLRLDPAKKNAF